MKRLKATIAALVVAIAAALVLAAPAGRAAATCASSEGPGIPPPAAVPAGIPGFHAAWYGQSGYQTLCPGQVASAVVAFYNSGSAGWVAGSMGEKAFLGTWDPEPGQDQPSAVGGDGTHGSPTTGWPVFNRVAAQPADYVGPGQVSWFRFSIQAPATPGTYRLALRPVIEGTTWMEDYGVFWIFTVSPASTPAPTATSSPAPVPTPTPTPAPPSTVSVSGVAPGSGPIVGGTTVTISGSGFAAGAKVTLGGAPAITVTVSSGTTITATTAAHGPGAVSVVVTNTDSSAGTCTGCFTYATPGPVAFPLAVSADGRSLKDRNGMPFRIHGDSGWSMIANLTLAEADTYLNDRQAKGFNAVIVNLIEHKFAVNAPADRNGDQPFTTAGSFATPNEAYFAFADSIIDLAASKGMLVLLDPMYIGFNGGDEGWWADLTNATNTRGVCYAYGQYLGKRYAGRSNIVWVSGGDYTPPSGSEGETRLHTILEGIQSVGGASRLVTGHWGSSQISTDEAAFAGAITLNGAYARPVPYAVIRRAYSYAPAMPSFLIEAVFEAGASQGTQGDPASVRSYEYGAYLFGIGGVLYGHRDIWEFSTDTWSSRLDPVSQRWQLSLNTPGAQDMARMDQLLDGLPWWTLVPSNTNGMKLLVTGGGGAFGNADYVTAAATRDGSTLVAYVPSTGTAATTITIDLSALSGPVRARWWNPTTGASTTIAAGLPNTGPRAFTTPGNNGTGANDWVLLLDRG